MSCKVNKDSRKSIHLSRLVNEYLYYMRNIFQSTKVVDGFSTCFRQWKATDTHCKFLHGYAVSFKLTFEGSLDHRNWVMDFGFLKRGKQPLSFPNIRSLGTKEGELIFRREEQDLEFESVDKWFKWMFDHTVVLAYNDPFYKEFENLNALGVIQLRTVEAAGCEKFAELVFATINDWLVKETDGRVKLVSVECREHEKNSAIFKVDNEAIQF